MVGFLIYDENDFNALYHHTDSKSSIGNIISFLWSNHITNNEKIADDAR
jgi:hypothetical protein